MEKEVLVLDPDEQQNKKLRDLLFEAMILFMAESLNSPQQNNSVKPRK